MSRQEVFNRVCEWNGLIGYGETIRDWKENIWGITVIPCLRKNSAGAEQHVLAFP